MEVLMWIIVVVGLVGAIVSAVYKYIINTDTYDNTDILKRTLK